MSGAWAPRRRNRRGRHFHALASLAFVACALFAPVRPAAAGSVGAQYRYWAFRDGNDNRNALVYYAPGPFHVQLEVWDYVRGRDQFRPEVGVHLRDRRRSSYTVQWRHELDIERLTLGTEQVLQRDGIGFHLVDWQNDAAFIVALVLFPERFTDEEIREGVDRLLVHVPAHVLEAARLGGYQTENIFMEKPLTADGPSSRKMLKLAEDATAKNLKVGVGLMSRHSHAMQELHKRIQDGEIGDAVMMRGNRMHGPAGSFRSTPKPPKIATGSSRRPTSRRRFFSRGAGRRPSSSALWTASSRNPPI